MSEDSLVSQTVRLVKPRSIITELRHQLPVETYVFALLLTVWLALAIVSPYFLLPRNITNILRQVSIDALLAFACLLPIILGRIDLSVGSIAAFTGVVFSMLISEAGMGPVEAFVCTLLVGLAIGVINGWAVEVLGIPAFIVTLAGLQVYRGFALLLTGGMTIGNIPPQLQTFALSTVLDIPTLFVLAAIVGGVVHFVLRFTRFGRYMYAIGSNTEAAHRVGIRVARISIATFAITALLSTIAGLLLVARLSMGNPTAAMGAELGGIAAAVVGGASLFGGRGTIFGCFVGALLFTTLSNGANLLGVNPFWQMVIEGILIGYVVFFDSQQKRKMSG
jgi:ribose transport system permease protein